MSDIFREIDEELRRDNLLKRYLATPMRPMHYILSHIFGRGFILAVELAAILLAGWLIFRFRIEGGLLPFVAFAALGAGSFTALAILCGSRSSNAIPTARSWPTTSRASTRARVTRSAR